MILRSTCSKRRAAVSGHSLLAAAAALAVTLGGCVVATTATWREARDNQRRVDRVQMGQTTSEVAAIMQHGPERREARVRFDGKTVEEWHYMTDAVRKRDTTITFLDDHAVEIRTTPWKDVD
jgi:hypothetical protein